MGFSRSVPRLEPVPEPERNSAVDVFEGELDYVYWTLRRFGARRSEVDDLLQDVFVTLCRKWPTLDTSRTLRPWLFGVVYRVMLAHRRRRGRERPAEQLDPTDDTPGAEAQLEAHESLAVLRAALERVPIERRSVIIMHEIDGVDVIDIAHELSITKSAVYARLDKGRKELAAAVRAIWDGGSR